jgi:DegV family protein with EDD domain
MIHIITDTTACLPLEIAARYKIPVVPQIVTFVDDSYYEGINIDNPTFMARLKASSEMPKTAAPPPELFNEHFARLSAQGGTIFCIHPSSEVSGTVRSASVAKMDYPEADIRVIDSRTVGSPLGTMVQLAAEWGEEGLEASAIEARLNSLIRRGRIYFLVSTLEYLVRGGRIGGAQALLGSMLQIKPILTLKDGRVEPFERERTHKRAINRLKEIVLEQIPRDGSGYLSIMHAGVPDQGQALAAELSVQINQPYVPVRDVPPAIVTHGGPGILAAAFFIKE